MPCYTFSVRSIFSASENKKIATKNIEEKENEQPEEEEYFTFEALIYPEFLTFLKKNLLSVCAIIRSKYNFSENFCYSFFDFKYPKMLFFAEFSTKIFTQKPP